MSTDSNLGYGISISGGSRSTQSLGTSRVTPSRSANHEGKENKAFSMISPKKLINKLSKSSVSSNNTSSSNHDSFVDRKYKIEIENSFSDRSVSEVDLLEDSLDTTEGDSGENLVSTPTQVTLRRKRGNSQDRNENRVLKEKETAVRESQRHTGFFTESMLSPSDGSRQDTSDSPGSISIPTAELSKKNLSDVSKSTSENSHNRKWEVRSSLLPENLSSIHLDDSPVEIYEDAEEIIDETVEEPRSSIPLQNEWEMEDTILEGRLVQSASDPVITSNDISKELRKSISTPALTHSDLVDFRKVIPGSSHYHVFTDPKSPFTEDPSQLAYHKIRDGNFDAHYSTDPIRLSSGSSSQGSDEKNLLLGSRKPSDPYRLPYEDEDGYRFWTKTPLNRECPKRVALWLLVGAILAPPVWIMMYVGFLDSSVGRLPPKYRVISGVLALSMIILTAMGIAVGFAYGLNNR
ncbi:hypothetical protein LJB42_003116 [Komagataella kurtzmanii]|nr:hypothetical protein LJB42_003116 [Komagataella kurtzmanii]